VKRGRGAVEVSTPLDELRASDLRFLCETYRIPRGGSKGDLIRRLLASGYPVSDVLQRAREIQFADLIAPYLHGSDLRDRLEASSLPVSGSRRELILRLIENRLFNARAILSLLPPRSFTDLYHSIFDKVPTVTRERAGEEILAQSGLAAEAFEARAGSKDAASGPFEHDIALSFAGEDRDIARRIGEELREAGVRVFYDEFYKPLLWGRNLSEDFRHRYGRSSRFVVPLISRHYAVKDWTDFEFMIARQEARQREQEFILPVRLDDTVLVGLRTDVAYLDFRHEGVDGVVSTVLEKLGVASRARTGTSEGHPSPAGARARSTSLEFYFRRHGARIHRFPVSWIDPQLLHQVEINAVVALASEGELSNALIDLAFDARLARRIDVSGLAFRPLQMIVHGKGMDVLHAQIPWKPRGGLSVFRSAPQRIFSNDLPITFMKEWVEASEPPFIYWELKAPGIEVCTGWVSLRRDKDDLVLVEAAPPRIEGFLQDGRGRSALTHPDLSLGPG